MSQELARSDPAAPVLLRAGEVRPLDAHRSLLFTLFKWKRLIAGLGLLLALAAGVALLLEPPAWSASAKILVKPDRVPLEVPGVGTATSASRTDVLATETELLESSSVLLPVARALRTARGSAPVADRELTGSVDSLRARLRVVPVPSSNVLQAIFTGDSPREAEETLRLVVDHYVEEHAAAYTGGKRLTAFYDKGLQESAAQLHDAENRLRQWQDAHNIVTLDAQINSQISTVGTVQASLKRVEMETGATRSLLGNLASQIAGQPERSVAGRQVGANPMIARLRADLMSAEATLREPPQSPVAARLRGELVTAQLALNDLRQRYTDEDRRIVDKAAQIALIEREIQTAEREATKLAVERVNVVKSQLAAAEREGDIVQSEMTTPNPLRESLTREAAAAQAKLHSLSSQGDALRGQLRDAEAALAALRGKRVDFDELSRQVEVAKTLYLANTKRLDDARVVAGLEKEHLGNITVIEPPRVLGGGKTLKRQLTLVGLAGVVGLGVGIAIAFGAELLNGTLRTPDEAEFYLGLPVVATVPVLAGAPIVQAFPVDVRESSARRTT